MHVPTIQASQQRQNGGWGMGGRSLLLFDTITICSGIIISIIKVKEYGGFSFIMVLVLYHRQLLQQFGRLLQQRQLLQHFFSGWPPGGIHALFLNLPFLSFYLGMHWQWAWWRRFGGVSHCRKRNNIK